MEIITRQQFGASSTSLCPIINTSPASSTKYTAMAETKDKAIEASSVSPSSDGGPSSDTPNVPGGVTYAERGGQVDEGLAAEGFDAERMRDRSLLTAEEEKKLLRRVDIRLMTVCSLLFLMKNLDADNISNARIMNRDTPRNIMTELGMSSDQYNLLNVLYYVSIAIFPNVDLSL